MRAQNIKYFKLIFAFVAGVAFCSCGTSCSISDAKIGVSEHTSAVSVDVDDATEPVDRGTYKNKASNANDEPNYVVRAEQIRF